MVDSTRVNLDQWNPAYWQKLRALLSRAQELGVYVEVDLIDAWLFKHSEFSAWTGANNVNGVNIGNCRTVGVAPTHPVILAWLDKVALETGSFDNVIYQIGNETFDCRVGGLPSVRPEYELGVARRLRTALQNGGFALKPIGTNSGRADLETHAEMDYVARHDPVMPTKGSKPMMVNEYNLSQEPSQFDSLLRQGHSRGISWHLWRSNQTTPQYEGSLDKLRQFHIDIGQ